MSAATQGTYFFNSNNTGELVLFDSNSGKTMAFGVVAALGNSSISGASVFGAPGPISDPRS